MNHFNFGKIAVLALIWGVASVSQADFKSITCSNEYQGVKSLALIQSSGPEKSYDFAVVKPDGSVALDIHNLDCRNVPNSGAGTFVSLVNCVSKNPADGMRIVVGHSANVNWADRAGDGNLVLTATGAEVNFVINTPAQLFPFQVLTFSPAMCHQVN